MHTPNAPRYHNAEHKQLRRIIQMNRSVSLVNSYQAIFITCQIHPNTHSFYPP